MAAELIKAIPPIFDVKIRSAFSLRKHLEDFETQEEAEKQRRSLLRAFKRYRNEERNLIGALDACAKGDRCRLLCCPVCARMLRLWFCDQVAPFVADEPAGFRFVTLVPERHRHSVGSLHLFNPQHLIDDFRTAIRKIGVGKSITFGSVDYSEEIRRDHMGRYHRFWCPHLHIVTNITTDDWSRLKIALIRYFPRTDNIHKPVMMKEIKSKGFGLVRPISYCVKSQFYSTYKSEFPVMKPDADMIGVATKPSIRSKKQAMHGRQRVELALRQARWRLKDRIILIGLKHVQKSIVRTNVLQSSGVLALRKTSRLARRP